MERTDQEYVQGQGKLNGSYPTHRDLLCLHTQ